MDRLNLRWPALALLLGLAFGENAVGQSPTPEINPAPLNENWGPSTPPNGRRFYGSLDYLLFGFRDGPAPPLIQTLPDSGFMMGGGVDASQAQTVFGNGIKYGGINGIRGEAGFWISDLFAIEGVYSQFERKISEYNIASPGSPSIGRYYYDVANGAAPLTYLIFSRPGGPESGAITATSPIRMYGAEINVRGAAPATFASRTDLIAGFRYLDLRDNITVTDFVQFNDGSGATITGFDSFSARNQFYGPQVGFNSLFRIGGGFTFDMTGKVALGSTQQQVVIDGSTTGAINGVAVLTAPGNVLTQPSNIGTYERGKFGVLSELMFKLGYQATDRVNLSFGYNLIALSSVMRAGSAIDEGVNPNQSPFINAPNPSTVARPAFAFNGTDFWAQGLTAGISLTY